METQNTGEQQRTPLSYLPELEALQKSLRLDLREIDNILSSSEHLCPEKSPPNIVELLGSMVKRISQLQMDIKLAIQNCAA